MDHYETIAVSYAGQHKGTREGPERFPLVRGREEGTKPSDICLAGQGMQLVVPSRTNRICSKTTVAASVTWMILGLEQLRCIVSYMLQT